MSDDAIAAGVVENLVTQFSSAYDSVRELVQNAIDAGTTRVEVWTEWSAGEGHEGVIELHVDDFGEGMDEQIIDEQLTRLFASSKENDLTKIGKFGIGFVSVFALKPKAVLLHTGRAGEYWEILFHADRSFTKTRLDVPVEGTQITLFIEGDFHQYADHVLEVRETLKRWCAHSETEVTFEDRSPSAEGLDVGEPEVVNEPFEVPGDCPARVEHDGTEIAVAYSSSPVYGFYNRGLTLALTNIAEQVFAEERSRRFAHVAVKVKSRYLEHTLSRDTVVRDESYDKAMGLLDDAREGPLLDSLVAEIEALVATAEWGLSEMGRYATLCAYLTREPEECLERVRGAKVLRGAQGGAFSLTEVDDGYGRDGRIFFSAHPTGLTLRLSEQGVPVLLGPAPVGTGSSGRRFFEAGHPLGDVPQLAARYVALCRTGSLAGRVRGLFGRDIAGEVQMALADPSDVYLPVAVDEEVPTEAKSLVGDAHRLLKSAGGGYKKLRTFSSDPTAADVPFFVTGRKLDSLMARPPERSTRQKGRLEAAVNRDDSHFKALLRLSKQSPALSSYCLAKCLLLHEDRLLDRDLKLMFESLGGGRH